MIPWEKIKAHWRKEFNKVEIYVDENEHILIFKEKNEFIILGYLHYNDKFWTSAQHIIDFLT